MVAYFVSSISILKIMDELQALFKRLFKDHWQFLYDDWPLMDAPKNHRTSIKDVVRIKDVKNTLMNRLGPVPVFYFLVFLWPNATYPGPYREVEKGLLVLYHLVTGAAMDALSPHIPKSSFHAIHTMFYKTHRKVHSKLISEALSTMFSNIQIRLSSARLINPSPFKHVTLHLDGHDTRLSCEEKTSAEMYSFKLKKAGVRTQVCVDCNEMAILVSKSLPCRDHNDGSMLLGMKLHKHIHPLDCIAVDGGYTQYIKKLMDENNDISKRNFCYPIRKHRGKELSKDELSYNKTFGSFRSQIEAVFGDLGTTFAKHNNRQPVLVTKVDTYNMQLQLCLLLLNIKKLIGLLDVETAPIHSAWMRDGFDYPLKNGAMEQTLEYIPVAEMLDDMQSMAKLQDEFLKMNTMDMDDDDDI
jgi:hypothetical protein